MTIEERFWPKVFKTETCWLWVASLNGKGYGQVYKDKRPQLAHRVSFELAYGPIPEGLVLDHMCHTPACVRPDHLRAVKHKVNLENRKGANANSKTGIRGVSWSTAMNKWLARVSHGGVVHDSFHDDVAEAEKAVIAKRKELFSVSY